MLFFFEEGSVFAGNSIFLKDNRIDSVFTHY